MLKSSGIERSELLDARLGPLVGLLSCDYIGERAEEGRAHLDVRAVATLDALVTERSCWLNRVPRDIVGCVRALLVAEPLTYEEFCAQSGRQLTLADVIDGSPKSCVAERMCGCCLISCHFFFSARSPESILCCAIDRASLRVEYKSGRQN